MQTLGSRAFRSVAYLAVVVVLLGVATGLHRTNGCSSGAHSSLFVLLPSPYFSPPPSPYRPPLSHLLVHFFCSFFHLFYPRLTSFYPPFLPFLSHRSSRLLHPLTPPFFSPSYPLLQFMISGPEDTP